MKNHHVCVCACVCDPAPEFVRDIVIYFMLLIFRVILVLALECLITEHLFDVFVWVVLMLCDRVGSSFGDMTDCVQAPVLLWACTPTCVFHLNALLFSLQLIQRLMAARTCLREWRASVVSVFAATVCVCVCLCVLHSFFCCITCVLTPLLMETDTELETLSSRIWNMLMIRCNNNNPSSHMQRRKFEKGFCLFQRKLNDLRLNKGDLWGTLAWTELLQSLVIYV